MSEWISVNNELPQIKTIDDSCVKDPISGRKIPPLYQSIKVLVFHPRRGIDSGRIEYFDKGNIIGGYTHWMPLPEPPNET